MLCRGRAHWRSERTYGEAPSSQQPVWVSLGGGVSPAHLARVPGYPHGRGRAEVPDGEDSQVRGGAGQGRTGQGRERDM